MNIKIKQLHMENFKCHANLTLDFGGKNASIYGDNATGKTSVYDALTWLLFGKDSAGNGEKNFEVKPLASDGSVKDHQAVTEVEAVLLADGDEVTLKRTYRELWSTKRGSSEPTYDGNTSEYYVDGVPLKANAFKAKVVELVDEELFKLLTTVSYFPAVMSWQKRREILFDLFGVLSDAEIMAKDARFRELAEGMGKRSLEDYKRMLTQQRKGFMTTRNEVPARISECEKTVADLSGMDFDAADARLIILNGRLDKLNRELLSIQENTALAQKRIDLKAALLELDELNRSNQEFRQSQKPKTVSTAGLEAHMNQVGRALESTRRSIQAKDMEILRLEDQIDRARKEWQRVNGEKYTGGKTCPCCGQPMPAAKLAAAEAAWTAEHKQKLEDLVSAANGYKADKVRAQNEMLDYMQYANEMEAEIQGIQKQIQAIEDSVVEITIHDMVGYTAKQDEISKTIAVLREEIAVLSSNGQAAEAEIISQIRQTKADISEAQGIAGKRAALEYAQNRIAQLREEAQAAADQLNGIDRMLYLLEEFSRYKASCIEGSINEHFRLATFRLYREQANGGVEDRCDVVYDGIPYGNLNNGMKINIGIDIINTLSREYGVSVPLFIDNAESVTNLEQTAGQAVRLVVSEEDKELRINHG